MNRRRPSQLGRERVEHLADRVVAGKDGRVMEVQLPGQPVEQPISIRAFGDQ